MKDFKEIPVISTDKDVDLYIDSLEQDFEEHSKLKELRLEVDQGLDEALKGLEELEAKLPKKQAENLITQCTNNALDAINGHFGLASAVLTNQDGGNVNTTHNARQGIYANEKEKQRYDNKEEYNSKEIHQDKSYINANAKQSDLKKQGKLNDYMTGKKINSNDNTDLDHVVAAKTIHDDRARVLAEVDTRDLANTDSNLKMTDSSLNRSKKAMSAEEFLNKRDERLQKLEQIKNDRGHLTQSEQNELAKLKKQKEIQDEEFLKQYNEEQKKIDKAVDKAYYTSSKPYKEAVITGAQDAAKIAKIAAYSAIGVVLKEFVSQMMIEIRTLFKEFGNESLKDICKRFARRLKIIWQNVKAKWKEVFAGSFEAGIQAFFSNLVVFLINMFVTTLKSIVRIIRAGFTSLWSAVKIIINPPANMPKEDVMYEASKIFITGLISAVTMLGAESLKTWLMTIPGLNVLLGFTIPFTSETIGDAIALALTAVGGAVLSTIVIYYMDKFRNQGKAGNLHMQIVTQSGMAVQYKVAQTWFVLHDAYMFAYHQALEAKAFIVNMHDELQKKDDEVKESLDKFSQNRQKLKQKFNKENR